MASRISASLTLIILPPGLRTARHAHRDAIGERRGFDGAHRLAAEESGSDGSGALRLHAQNARSALDQAQRLELAEALPDSGNGAAVAYRNRHPIGGLPGEVFGDFQAGRFFPLDEVGVDGRVAVVPAPFLARALAQLKGVLIAAAHARSEERRVGDESRYRR